MSYPLSLPAPRIPQPKRSTLILGAAALAIVATANASLFRVRQNEVAYVARFGQVLSPASGPLAPGLHVKIPFADTFDTIATSTDTIRMPAMKAFTRDTQEVTLQVSLTYRVPASAAYHLLYEVGRAGNIDIGHNLEAVANDRVRSIVAHANVTDIAGEGREKIMDEIKAVIAQELKRLFLVEVQDVQIPQLDFSAQYKEAVNRATLARAQRVQSEQDRERARVEAETAIVRAKGEADSQVARAEGDARAQVSAAKARAEATRLAGDAEAGAIHAKIAAAGGVDGYARQLQAQAALNWKGTVPHIMGAGSAQFPLVLPIPAEKPRD